jgi:hypothetical protein
MGVVFERIDKQLHRTRPHVTVSAYVGSEPIMSHAADLTSVDLTSSFTVCIRYFDAPLQCFVSSWERYHCYRTAANLASVFTKASTLPRNSTCLCMHDSIPGHLSRHSTSLTHPATCIVALRIGQICQICHISLRRSKQSEFESEGVF